MSYKSLFVSAVIAASAATMVGCAAERHEVVPSSAILGAEGDERLTFTSDGPGTIYIYDQDADKLLYSGHVTGRRQVAVDPERNEITVDGALVQGQVPALPGNNRKIYFHPTVR